MFIAVNFNARIGMAEGAEYRIRRFGLGLRNNYGNRLLSSCTPLDFSIEISFS